MSVKPCVRCGSTDRTKPLASNKLGNCKPCARRWREQNREYMREYQRRYRPGWYAKNRAREAVLALEYYHRLTPEQLARRAELERQWWKNASPETIQKYYDTRKIKDQWIRKARLEHA